MPETYSYTLSAALEYGCMIAITDLGAPVERLAGRENSWALPWQTNAQQWAEFFTNLYDKNNHTLSVYNTSLISKVDDCKDFYTRAYLVFKPKILAEQHLPDLSNIVRGVQVNKHLSGKEKLLVFIYRFYTHKFFQKIVKIIPVSLLRRVKTILSNQPMNKLIK